MVVIVEDNPFVRMAASDALIDAGIEVLEAESTDHAVELLEREAQAKVLFTDIRMSGAADGIDLARTVASRWPDVGIIVTSCHVGPGEAEIPNGATFLPKPYRLPALLRAVLGILNAPPGGSLPSQRAWPPEVHPTLP